MGAGEKASDADVKCAYELGKLIAQEGWVLLSGGRNAGVMDSVNQGAKAAGGLTVGIMPTKDTSMISDAVDIPVITDMGSARNNINVLTSDVVIACGIGGAGTASEVALALKSKKQVILLNESEESQTFFRKIGGDLVRTANSPEEAIGLAKQLLTKA